MSSSENFAARLAFRRSTADTPPLGEQLATLRHLKRFFAQIWRTSRSLTVASILLRLARACCRSLTLYIGKLIIDEVVLLVRMPGRTRTACAMARQRRAARPARLLLALEFALAVLSDVLGRVVSLVDGAARRSGSPTRRACA